MVNLPDGEAMREGARADGDRATRGAVYVEFLIVFLPLFFFFLALVQLLFLHTANLMVKNAAVKAARAAIVVLHDDPTFYNGVPTGRFSGARKSDIERAAAIPLLPLVVDSNAIPNLASGISVATMKVQLMNTTSIVGRDDLLTVRVEFDYACKVPGGRFLVCFPTTFKHLVGEAAMPNQGADFTF